MVSTVLSATLRGLCVEFIRVEADTSNGLPMFHMVGNLSSEGIEAGERVRTAIRNSGIMLPAKIMVINLSPANMRKKGSMFDLPIAVAILASIGEVELTQAESILMIGELSLDGGVKSVPGVLPIVLEAKKRGCEICIVPKENQKEGALVEGITVVGVETLKEVCQILKTGYREQQSSTEESWETQVWKSELDYSEVHGLQAA